MKIEQLRTNVRYYFLEVGREKMVESTYIFFTIGPYLVIISLILYEKSVICRKNNNIGLTAVSNLKNLQICPISDIIFSKAHHFFCE